jgi:hypothetical protein
MAWTFYNSSGEELINDGGVQAGSAVFTGKVDLGSNLLVGNAGSTGISISSIGIVQMVKQPAFLYYNPSTITNETGNNTQYTCIFSTKVIDQNDDFDGTSTFTAPVTGVYRLSLAVNMGGVTSSGTRGRLRIVTPNRTYEAYWHPSNNEVTTDSISFCQMHVLADIDASEAVTTTVLINGEGSDVCDFGGTSELNTWFAGELVA